MREPSLQDATPRYAEIADILQHEIESGVYREDERLPSESQLCRRFRENRYTVRQALDLLLRSGVIQSHQGKGHYVSEKPLNLQYTITPNTRFSDIITNLGCTPHVRLLSQEKRLPPEKVAQALMLEPGDEAFRLEILRYADAVPLTWNITWLPVRYFPGLLERTASFRSLYALFEEAYQVKLHRMWSTFQATFPTALEASYLKVPPNINVLHIESVMRDNDYRLLEYTSAKYRGDLCRVSIQFES